MINKFRGDVTLFEGGLQEITQRTGWPALGVAPYFADAVHLPPEDAMALDQPRAKKAARIKIAVPKLSRIANFDDLDPLRSEPDVAVEIIAPGQAMPGDADLILLPGSKSTIADLAFLRQQGWDIDILAHHRRGGRILGICGGYQMLGTSITDPHGLEGEAREAIGLGLLAITTVLSAEKRLGECTGIHVESGEAVRGYEIHLGLSEGADLARPFIELDGRADGARSADGKVAGCYLHGLMAADGFRHAFLSSLRVREDSGLNYDHLVDRTLDGLAQHLETHLDLDRMLEIAHAA